MEFKGKRLSSTNLCYDLIMSRIPSALISTIFILQSSMLPFLNKNKLTTQLAYSLHSSISSYSNLPLRLYFSTNKPHTHQSSKKILEKQQRRKMKEKMEREEIEQMNRKVNLTTGGYNPMTSYLSIYKYYMLGSFLFSLIFVAFALGGSMVGRSEVWVEVEREGEKKLKKKKKMMVISEEAETKKSPKIEKIFKNIYEECEPTKSLTAKINSLEKSGIKSNITLVDSQQPILLILPNNTALISSYLLRKLDAPKLTQLFYLLESAFAQRYHIRDLQLKQIMTFRDSSKIGSQIKLRQIYSRPYSELELRICLELVREKTDAESIKNILMSIRSEYERTTRQTKMQKENILNRLPLFE